jgi:DNA replication factor GINS
MNLDELQSVRDRERQTDKLQQLRETFYEDAGEFIQQLRDQRERAAERADDPFDAPEVSRLSDEIDTAEQTVEAIYEKRVGKIVKAASFAAADLPAESDGMTAEEQDLFETLVENIKANRQHVMDVLEGKASGSPADTGADTTADSAETPLESAAPPTDTDDVRDGANLDAGRTPPPPEAVQDEQPSSTGTDSSVNAADAMGGADATPAESTQLGSSEKQQQSRSSTREQRETESDQSPDSPGREPEVRKDGGTGSEQSGIDRETVRITKDVGDFLGFDEREYDLSANDVVTLPATNVEPLVSRDAAERLD